ncbi:MAG: DUF3160 domain-containing protein, partial [Candidatus Hodarchaeota archaeon]
LNRSVVIGGIIGLIIISGLFSFIILNPNQLFFLDNNDSDEEVPDDSSNNEHEFNVGNSSVPFFYSILENFSSRFGEYIPLNMIYPEKGPYFLYKADLSDVNEIDKTADSSVLNMLKKQGFAVKPSKVKQFYSIYQTNADNNMPQFITTDSVLHTFHIIFDYSLRYLETEYLYDDLLKFTENMLNWALYNYNITSSPNLKASFKHLSAYFVVGETLLTLENDFKIANTRSLPSEIQTLVDEELANIETHDNYLFSPITGNEIDYTQFIVRGHYTRTQKLSNFFLAMMYYGFLGFYLEPYISLYDGTFQTRMALLMTLGIFSDPTNQTREYWEHIYDPTVFYVGQADDLTFYEYKSCFGDHNISELENDTLVMEFIEEAKQLRSPRILGAISWDLGAWQNSTKGFRIMGQRFIPDSYFFQNLIHPEVSNRSFPSGLDIMAVFNSSRALTHQIQESNIFSEYIPQINMLLNEVHYWNETVWTQNLYFLWLYSLLPLLNTKGIEYPNFMRTDAWMDKELNTALGSWAELRHDTILYAKQTYPPTTGIEYPPTPPFEGWVEPNPELYNRLYSLTELLENGLEERNLLEEGSVLSKKISSLKSMLYTLKNIAQKELLGYALSASDLAYIKNIGDSFESIVTFPPAVEYDKDVDKSVAVIADVYTDPNSYQVLEVGVGYFYVIYVIIKDNNGLPYLSRGGVFSYYEFKQPMAQRLTDETWQELLAMGNAPSLPEWTNSFIITVSRGITYFNNDNMKTHVIFCTFFLVLSFSMFIQRKKENE